MGIENLLSGCSQLLYECPIHLALNLSAQITGALSALRLPRLRHRPPVGFDDKGVELDGFAALRAGDFLSQGIGRDLGPVAAARAVGRACRIGGLEKFGLVVPWFPYSRLWVLR